MAKLSLIFTGVISLLFELFPAVFMILQIVNGNFNIYFALSLLMDILKIVFICITMPSWCKTINSIDKLNLTLTKTFYIIYLICMTIFSVTLASFIIMDIINTKYPYINVGILFAVLFLVYAIMKLSLQIIYTLDLIDVSTFKPIFYSKIEEPKSLELKPFQYIEVYQ